MLPVLLIKIGTTMRGMLRVEEVIESELGRIPECFKTITIDADYSPNPPDILLDREAAKNLLRNPNGYKFEIDYSNAKKILRSLDSSSKGALLSKPVGRVLSYVSIPRVVEHIRRTFKDVLEGAKVEKRRGSSILDKPLIIIVASPFTGVGSSNPPDTISVAKYLFPNAYIILITSFKLCSVATGLKPSQFEKAKKNACEFIAELAAIRNGENPATFYPYLKDGILHFLNFKIPARLPDFILDVRPKTNSLEELIEIKTLLIRDLVLHGIPLFLEHIENVITDLEGNVISVTAEHYRFPTQQIREWIEDRAFREQLSISIKTDISRSVLAENTLSGLF